ncbi:hypothetical protein AMTRI_Chr02g215850 [Amborella trichopoda]
MCHMALMHEERKSNKHEREEAPLDHHTPPALSSALNRPSHSSIRALSYALIRSHSTICDPHARQSTRAIDSPVYYNYPRKVLVLTSCVPLKMILSSKSYICYSNN